jgi:hypothetical protein
VLLGGDDDSGVPGPERIPDIFAPLFKQKLILRIKLNPMWMLALLGP